MVAAFLERRGSAPVWGVAVTALPGCLSAASFLGPEPLGTALALGGVLAWRAPRRTALAVGLFAAAGLCRESLLLVPAAVGLAELVRARSHRRVLWLAAAPAAWLAWVGVVRLRLGHWPTEVGTGRLGRPLAGLVDAAGGWGPADRLVALAAVAVVVASVVARRERALVAAHAAFALCMGPLVWSRWEDFSRPLLPLFALGLVAVASRCRAQVGLAPVSVPRNGMG